MAVAKLVTWDELLLWSKMLNQSNSCKALAAARGLFTV
jgi:hypothetical protein